MGNPVGVPLKAMMTMATLTVDRTTSWCSFLPPTLPIPSSTPASTTVSKLDEHNNKNKSYPDLSALRGTPTRIPPKTPPPPPHDGVDVLVDDADACNANKTTMLPPSTLEQAAPLLYQLGLAAVMAAIDRMKESNAVSNINPNNLHHVVSDTTRVELSAALATLATNWHAPPHQEAAKTPEADPMLSVTMDDRSADDGNRPTQRPTVELLPAEPPPTTITATPAQTPNATQALRDFLDRYPRPIDRSDEEDGHHLHDESRLPSNLNATIQLQSKVVRTLTVLCGEISDQLDLILGKIQCNNLSPSMIRTPTALLTNQSPPPAKIILGQRIYPVESIQLWLQCHTDPRTKLVPVVKFTPYKKPIPAKPPFTRGRRPTVANRTKDYMRPP